MARYGFNGGKTEMKIFVLFVMRHVLDPVTLEQMSEMVLIDDNMNYFLFCECVADLVDSEMLIKEPGQKRGEVYTLTPHGYETLSSVEKSLPISLRRAAQETTLLVMDRLRRESLVHAEMVTSSGEPMARLTMTDGRDPILRLEVVTGSTEQARDICINFRQHADTIFDNILRVLLDNDASK